MSKLQTELSEILDHLSKRGFETRDLEFERPARQAEVDRAEAELGFKLPPSFREVLSTVSSQVGFWWYAPDDFKFPPPFRSNFSGQLEWSLEHIFKYEKGRMGWVEKVFPNDDDAYHAVWHNKLAFSSIGNGDYLAIDLSPTNYERIVYLSHDDGGGHGHILADDFADLLRRWAPLACTGAEDWQWLPFTSDRDSRIDPTCENAKAWRELLGLAA